MTDLLIAAAIVVAYFFVRQVARELDGAGRRH